MLNGAWRPGDILAFWGTDAVSRAISWGTASLPLFAPAGLRVGPSHVGIIARHPRLGMQIVESTTLCRSPCNVRGECVSGCQAHDPLERIAEYEAASGRVRLFRMSWVAQESLSKGDHWRLSELLFQFVTREVDYSFGRAMLSGTRVLSRTRLLPADAHHSVFCSQLVASVLMEFAKLPRGNASAYSPARLLRELVANGTYARVPAFDLPEDGGPKLRLWKANDPGTYQGPERAAA